MVSAYTMSKSILKKDTGGKIKFTVSIGISESTTADNEIDQIIHRADMAMYRAKVAGRNRVEI
jgi:diguanylate cyclase (GGDEF)-like protein